MTPRELFEQAAADMEMALANALSAAVEFGSIEDIERILKLVIKKEIVLELLLEEFPRDDA